MKKNLTVLAVVAESFCRAFMDSALCHNHILNNHQIKNLFACANFHRNGFFFLFSDFCNCQSSSFIGVTYVIIR